MFISDLKLGQKYEQKLLELLPYDTYTHKVGYSKKKNIEEDGFNKNYDLTITKDGITTKYEVKSDRRAINTLNIALEFECRRKPSGIMTTEADIYAYFIIKPDDLFDLYLIPVEDLKNMITEKKYKRFVNGGDGWLSKMYLMSLNDLQQYLYKI
jgi:hypothetical protein